MFMPWRSWLLVTLVGQVGGVSADPPDRYGDPLPRGAIARLGSARLRPAGRRLAFTPDSRFLATVHEGVVSVFDAHDGKVVRQWRSNHMSGDGLAFTPDGKQLVAGAGSTAFPYADHAPGLWDWRAGRLLRRFRVPQRDGGKELGEMLLSPDGTQVALCHIVRDGAKITASTFSLRDLKGDRVLHTWPGSAFAYCPNRALAALGSYRKIQLVDLRTGMTVRAFSKVPGEVSKMAFTPDGKVLAALAPSLDFWDVASGERFEDFLPDKDYPTFGEFCLACRHPWVATRDRGGTVRVWDFAARKVVARFDPPGRLAAFSPDDKTLVIRHELLLRLWDTATWQERCRQDGHSTWLYQAVYSPDGRRVATSAGPHVLLWDTATGKLLLARDFSDDYLGSITSIKWSADGRTIASVDRRLRFWDSGTGKDLVTLSGQIAHRDYYFHPRHGHMLIFLPDAGDIHKIDLVQWDPRANTELSRKHLGGFWPRALSPDGLRMVLEDGFFNVHVWDGKEMRKIEHPRPSWRVFAALGDRYIALSDRTMIGLWDSRTGKELWKSDRAAGLADGPRRHEFSPDGTYLYVSGWSAPRALRTGDGRLVRTYRLDDFQWLYDCRLSPDGRALVCVVAKSKDMTNLQFVSIETATGKVRRRFAIPPSVPPWTVGMQAVAPDSTTFLSRGPGLSALVWDLAGLGEARRLGRPRPEELEGLWQDLAGEDAGKAHRAVARFVVGAGAARDFLAGKLRPARPVATGHVAHLVGQLVDDDPAFRTKARAALRALDRQAAPALRQALRAAPAAELRGILQRLLDDADGLLGPGPLLQQVRAVEALEHLGASKLLSELARGDPAHRLTQECQGALRRRPR
jgi:WD40 repeat protein